MDPLAVGFLATIHRMLEMQAAIPPCPPSGKDISAALAGLGAVPGSRMLPGGLLVPPGGIPLGMVPNVLPRHPTATLGTNNNIQNVVNNNNAARKRENLERKIAEMRYRQQREEKSTAEGETTDSQSNKRDEREKKESVRDAEDGSPVVEVVQQLMTYSESPLYKSESLSLNGDTGDESNGEQFKSSEGGEKHHKRTHSKKIDKKLPSICDQCGKHFASGFQLREHVSILHLNERNFQCEYCGTKFGRRGGLRRHVQMVHLNQMHMCPYEGCDHPGYKCSKALAAHIRSVHTNQRPYQCDLCTKAFVRRNDLKMHQLTHTKQTLTFSCECGSKFRRLIYLKKHQRNCSMASVEKTEGDEEEEKMMETMDDDGASDQTSNADDSRMGKESSEEP